MSNQPLSDAEHEAEARRLFAALSQGRPTTLSGAKAVFARLMGRANWHEAEQHHKKSHILPWENTDESLARLRRPPRIHPLEVETWLGGVETLAPHGWSDALWAHRGKTAWHHLAPLLCEGHQRGYWTLTAGWLWPVLGRMRWTGW
jgi:hypothetical protein